ncbi:uracil-DNA glycosylase family protein [Vulgatibacter sp.]|uniref:uracil-DNA glycosylase family protein n=1 Tax=Vulgatibacter sp. TaxID=1971226 RepID=UPI00356634CD
MADTWTDDLVAALRPLRFGPPVTHVYNPLEYARAPWDRYVERWGAGRREVLLLGMNPGPFGMAQTGVPFGDVGMVRDWLGIEAAVGKPAVENPKRPIVGFACPRSEVSGTRLWGFFRETFGTPERFFARFFVANYCPLVFMEASGRNVTPDKLPAAERAPLFAACDEALRRIVDELQPRLVIGVGGFAEKRAREALGGRNLQLGCILHPSPASPAANRGWGEVVRRQLAGYGVELPPPAA